MVLFLVTLRRTFRSPRLTPLRIALLLGVMAWSTGADAESPFLQRIDSQTATAVPTAPAAEVAAPPALEPQSPVAPRPDYERALRRGHLAYARGDYKQAIARYEEAGRIDPSAAAPWANGGAVLDESGAPREAARWYGRAAGLDATDNEILCALGWAQLRARAFEDSAASFQRVLKRDPDHTSALLGLARVELARGHPRQAVSLLTRADGVSPFANLVHLFLGRAYDALGDLSNAISAYRQGAGSDSSFLEARKALGRTYLRTRQLREALRQFSKILDADPNDSQAAALLSTVRPLLARSDEAPIAQAVSSPVREVAASEAFPKNVPVLRIGVGTDVRGRPRARRSLSFSATTDFILSDAKTGRPIAQAPADQIWTVRLTRVKGRTALELTADSGRIRMTRRDPLVIAPRSRDRGLVAIEFDGQPQGPAAAADKLLRGEVEIAAWRKTLRIVNRLDLENYTHGVLAAEMPIRSPLEALKAQAVVARTHALYLKTVARRHRRDGYDICDGQHCQVYSGLRAEGARSRAVVEATRGIVVTYRGGTAQVIYESNCGGRSQDGRELTGWGDVPYWASVADSVDPSPVPDSPWSLRQWLGSIPPAYCKPSNFVHPAHYRWARVIPWTELSRRIDRRYHTGRLLRIRTLRRAPSGHVNALLLEGARRKVKVDSETAIRSLPGMGSLRSTLFVFTPEFGPDGRPEALVVQGGGWGHGAGLCQSGAMGRAEAGQDFLQIILAYFPGTALGRCDYAPAVRDSP